MSRGERCEISILKRKGYSWGHIAAAMDRAKSSLWNEWKRNQVARKYVPKKAHHKAYVRRKYAKYQGKKIVENANLRQEVEWRLLDNQSPHAIAGWLKCHRKHHADRASKNAIIRYLASVYGRRIEAALWLHKKKRRWRTRRTSPQKLVGRTFIDQRPKKINERKRIGDAEGDFIVSGKSGRGILLVVTDRKSRASFLERVLPVSIRNVHHAFLRIKARFPELTTLTTDNDLLFAHHEELEKLLAIKIYFCHPYHSWEKGTIENANGVIRRDCPKGSDLSRYSRKFFMKLEAKLNRRPMKILGYRSSQEVLDVHRRRVIQAQNKKRPEMASF